MLPAFAPGGLGVFRWHLEQLSSRRPSLCEFLCLRPMGGNLSSAAGHLTASRCLDTVQSVPTSVAAAPPLQLSPPPPRTCVRKNHRERNRVLCELCRGCGHVSPPRPLCSFRWVTWVVSTCTCGQGVVCEWARNVLGHPTMEWCVDRPHSCHLLAFGPVGRLRYGTQPSLAASWVMTGQRGRKSCGLFHAPAWV